MVDGEIYRTAGLLLSIGSTLAGTVLGIKYNKDLLKGTSLAEGKVDVKKNIEKKYPL